MQSWHSLRPASGAGPDSSQAALEKLVESKERREQELYIKVATLSFWLCLLTHIVISSTEAAVTLFTGSLPTLRCKLRNWTQF